jgi:hypothetical protein
MPPTLRDVGRLALLVSLSLALCAGVLELGLRLFWSDFYLKFRADRPGGRVEFHSTRGWAPAPSSSLAWGGPEFTVTMSHNARGFRGPEILDPLPPGRLRVLVLGDSQTYGHGVEDDEPYSAVLAARDPRLEVLNAGVGAYSGAHELLLLREEIAALEPELVLVGFFWNDVAEAHHGRYARFVLDRGKPVLVAPVPASPEHPDLASRSRRRHERSARYDSPLVRSYSYRLLSDRWKLLGMIVRERWSGTRVSRHRVDESEIEAAWALSFALLEEMAQVARRHGAGFAILLIPDQVQVEPDVRVVGLPPYALEVQERVPRFAREAGLTVIDLLPALREARRHEDAPLYYRFDRHLNARGHARAGAAIYDELLRLGLLPAPTAAVRARRGQERPLRPTGGPEARGEARG